MCMVFVSQTAANEDLMQKAYEIGPSVNNVVSF